MSALAAVVLGVLGIGYAVWPALQARGKGPLPDEFPEDGYAESDADREGEVLRRWSVEAGELEDDESPPAADPAEGDL
jgi:hypothetical protein